MEIVGNIFKLPTFHVELGDILRPEYTLEEIFNDLAAADNPCIVAIDEFQQLPFSRYFGSTVLSLFLLPYIKTK